MSAAQPERRDFDLGALAPARRVEPQASFAAQASPPPARPVPAPVEKVLFETDAPAAPAKASFTARTEELLRRLADLLRRPDAPTPFAIGLFASAGGGKSSAIDWLTEPLAATGAPVVVLRAADLAEQPERALAAALYRALAPHHGPFAQEAALEAPHFGADPGAIARAARDELLDLRRKLIAEKQALSDSEMRRAALKDILLFETPGTRVDIYARKIRNAFEPRLRRFGFTGEALAAFKDLTRDLNESGGLAGRLLASLRGLYAFKGQTRLLLLSALGFAADKGLAWLAANKADLLGLIASGGSIGGQAANFLQSHLDWLPVAARLFALLALALLGLNIWRAVDFMQPLIHAAGLLDRDVVDKRHEVEQTLAHQARNVELMGSEVDALARKAYEAERRANAAGASRNPPLFLEGDEASRKRDHAVGFLETISDLVTRGTMAAAPRRIVVAVDGYESADQSDALFRRVHDLLALPGFVAIHALDPALFHDRGDELARRIQLPLRLDGVDTGEPIALAPFDTPLSPLETRLTGAMAPLAGANPRAGKRLRNLFRFLRPAPDAPAGLTAALALFVAAEIGGSAEDRAALARALGPENHTFAPAGSPALREAFANASAIDGPIGLEDAKRAAALARRISVA
ncbi:hypothetical protein [Rhodoblastus sp.]|uniref:hypothetical protein n=1 Tax=Rhodoblastus sp. TaxID=1962975 RepID=UPI003F9CFF05